MTSLTSSAIFGRLHLQGGIDFSLPLPDLALFPGISTFFIPLGCIPSTPPPQPTHPLCLKHKKKQISIYGGVFHGDLCHDWCTFLKQEKHPFCLQRFKGQSSQDLLPRPTTASPTTKPQTLGEGQPPGHMACTVPDTDGGPAGPPAAETVHRPWPGWSPPKGNSALGLHGG